MSRTTTLLVLTLATSCAHFGGADDEGDSKAKARTGCELACENMTRLKCPGHEGTPGKDEIAGTDDDVSCADACFDFSTANPPVDMQTGCVISATSCHAVDSCRAD